ncbi:MAG: hypothetical protein LIP02_10955 [Bacteroidales bacterium]|nr:hypothetical protein [Bacteroidales bacterium]
MKSKNISSVEDLNKKGKGNSGLRAAALGGAAGIGVAGAGVAAAATLMGDDESVDPQAVGAAAGGVQGAMEGADVVAEAEAAEAEARAAAERAAAEAKAAAEAQHVEAPVNPDDVMIDEEELELEPDSDEDFDEDLDDGVEILMDESELEEEIVDAPLDPSEVRLFDDDGEIVVSQYNPQSEEIVIVETEEEIHPSGAIDDPEITGEIVFEEPLEDIADLGSDLDLGDISIDETLI